MDPLKCEYIFGNFNNYIINQRKSFTGWGGQINVRKPQNITDLCETSSFLIEALIEELSIILEHFIE